MTDLGSAYKLVELAEENIRFLVGTGWLIYNGKYWEKDLQFKLDQKTESVATWMRRQAAEMDGNKAQDALWKWAKYIASNHGMKNLQERAKRLAGVALLPDELNRDKWKLNCLNGTFDFKTGELHPHNRDDYISEICPVEYKPEAKSDLWEKFLTRVLPDEQVRRYIQKAIGYSATGSTELEKLFFTWGKPATGKSTFLEAVKGTLGTYAATADFDTFIKRERFSGAPRTDIAALAGKRFIPSIEVEEGERMAEALICQLTGGDTIRARFLYQESFEFKPQLKLWLCANTRPSISGTESAIWRRLVQLPFTEVIPESEQNPAVKTELTNVEVSGAAVLAWIVKGCLLWQDEGLEAPEAVRVTTADYRAEQDRLIGFLEECCVIGEGKTVKNAHIYKAYQNWAKDVGERYPLGQKHFLENWIKGGFIKLKDVLTPE